jgi:hypothetical protein
MTDQQQHRAAIREVATAARAKDRNGQDRMMSWWDFARWLEQGANINTTETTP